MACLLAGLTGLMGMGMGGMETGGVANLDIDLD
jgi:hypothetical protein